MKCDNGCGQRVWWSYDRAQWLHEESGLHVCVFPPKHPHHYVRTLSAKPSGDVTADSCDTEIYGLPELGPRVDRR